MNNKNNYITTFYFYEPSLDGSYNTEPHEYIVMGDEKATNEQFKDIIFQCCEIERIYKGKMFVEIQITKNGEYVDSDELEFKVNIELTKSLSEFIRWEKCPNLPPIYSVDKEKSRINFDISDEKDLIVIEIKEGFVDSVYSDNPNIDIIINDRDSLLAEDCVSTDGLKRIY